MNLGYPGWPSKYLTWSETGDLMDDPNVLSG
jgi:hypothetical protein